MKERGEGGKGEEEFLSKSLLRRLLLRFSVRQVPSPPIINHVTMYDSLSRNENIHQVCQHFK